MDEIYSNLEEFNFSDQLKQLQEKNEKQHQQILKLVRKLEEYVEANEQLKKTNKNIEENISSLFKTATAEIARKDKMISELRTELDSVIFQKNSRKNFISKERDQNTTPKVESFSNHSAACDSESVPSKSYSQAKYNTPLYEKNSDSDKLKNCYQNKKYPNKDEHFRDRKNASHNREKRRRSRSSSRGREKSKVSNNRQSFESKHALKPNYKGSQNRSDRESHSIVQNRNNFR